MSDSLWNRRYLPAVWKGDVSYHDCHVGSRLQWQDGLQRVQRTLGSPQPVEGLFALFFHAKCLSCIIYVCVHCRSGGSYIYVAVSIFYIYLFSLYTHTCIHICM